MKRLRRQMTVWALAGTLSALVLATPAAATCGGSGPGATLLFPFFEVDAEQRAGRSTLVSIHNFSPRPQLTHVVMWTNCAIPVLDFDLYLDAYELQSIDLGQILIEGRLPESGSKVDPPPGCTSPLAQPVFDPAELRRQLSGAPVEGLCYAAADEETAVTGYLTVDVVKGCSERIRTPYDEGYFGTEGDGLAGDENVLTGEIFLVDSLGDAAQGLAAVTLRADATLRAGVGAGGNTFYRRGDGRQPLPAVHQVHYLNGGAFDDGTDLLFWLDPGRLPFDDTSGDPEPWSCGVAATTCSEQTAGVVLRGRNEAGVQPAEDDLMPRVYQWLTPTRSGRLRVGEDVPVETAFGTLEVCPGLGRIGAPLAQGWVMPVHTAQGRYSVGLRSMGLCDEDLPRHPPAVDVPRWLENLIIGSECGATVPQLIQRYTYKGDTVYLIPPYAPDLFADVYDESGGYVCAPYGGIAGEGDGKCPDFAATATDETLVWENPKSPERVVVLP